MRMLHGERVVAVVRHDDPAVALDIAEACLRAGLRAIEITWTVPSAGEVVSRLRDAHQDALIGAGTVLDRRQLAEALDSGAAYVVTPGIVDEVVEDCLSADVPVLPGVLTPTEVLRMRALGLKAVKLFPASTVGPAHLSSLRAVAPDLDFVPTGGIDDTNAGAWITAGAAAVGLASALNRAHARGGPAAVETLALATLAAVDEEFS
jgi:2-dehydro-3-deoxyphosphogluconate aldolase / (4S)-4-hydroxy-2-oxoglutarate aldolase